MLWITCCPTGSPDLKSVCCLSHVEPCASQQYWVESQSIFTLLDIQLPSAVSDHMDIMGYHVPIVWISALCLRNIYIICCMFHPAICTSGLAVLISHRECAPETAWWRRRTEQPSHSQLPTQCSWASVKNPWTVTVEAAVRMRQLKGKLSFTIPQTINSEVQYVSIVRWSPIWKRKGKQKGNSKTHWRMVCGVWQGKRHSLGGEGWRGLASHHNQSLQRPAAQSGAQH